MTALAVVQLLVYLGVILALAKPLGIYMARVYEGRPCGLDRVLGPVERFLYRISGVKPGDEMDWKRYAVSMLLFNVLGCSSSTRCSGCRARCPSTPAHFPRSPPTSPSTPRSRS